jgi:hypothetical protein
MEMAFANCTVSGVHPGRSGTPDGGSISKHSHSHVSGDADDIERLPFIWLGRQRLAN